MESNSARTGHPPEAGRDGKARHGALLQLYRLPRQLSRRMLRRGAGCVVRNCFLFRAFNEGQQSASPQSRSKLPGRILQLGGQKRDFFRD